jgi:dienelactone hydrolase
MLFLILLSPLTAAYPLSEVSAETFANSSNTPEWYDGHFNGQFYRLFPASNGTISGTITLGKSSFRGTFSANWMLENTTGTAKGIFNKKIILGIIQETTAFPFIGHLTVSPCSLTAIIWIPLKGVFSIYSHYDASFLYPPAGPFQIGVKNYHLIDESRLENFTENDPNDVREMMVQIWYPLSTLNASHEYPTTSYMDAITFQWLKRRSPIPLVTIPDHAYQYVLPHGVVNPPIDTVHSPFPVIIFSHGYDGVYQIYTSLIEDLVSHGYIIVSINHPYIAGVTVFPDNRTVNVSVIPSDPTEREAWLTLGYRSVIEDAKFVLDVITEMNSSDPFFDGSFDLNHVGMYGHSFGGGATAGCCYEDTRFDAGLTLDGFSSADSIAGGLSTPMCMLVTGERFLNDSTLDDIWNNLTGNAYLVGIKGSQHYSYTDIGILLQHLLPLIPPNILGFGTIDQKRMINITVSIERAFFDVYLRGESPDVLISLLNQYSEIDFKQK